jgi:hypothetical protein
LTREKKLIEDIHADNIEYLFFSRTTNFVMVGYAVGSGGTHFLPLQLAKCGTETNELNYQK